MTSHVKSHCMQQTTFAFQPKVYKIARWIKVFTDYDFEVQYFPGEKHHNLVGLFTYSSAPEAVRICLLNNFLPFPLSSTLIENRNGNPKCLSTKCDGNPEGINLRESKGHGNQTLQNHTQSS